MTEKEAWLFISQRWYAAKPVEDHGQVRYFAATEVVPAAIGLCASIVDLYDTKKISSDTYNEMLVRLEEYRELTNRHGLYIWNHNRDGALARAEFCKTQAENPIDVPGLSYVNCNLDPL